MTQRMDLSDFINRHHLPGSYITTAEKWFLPLTELILKKCQQQGTPLVIGINGSQGSGKSTLADLLVYSLQQRKQVSAVALSIDDFYLTRNERQSLAQKVHPLLATRGVPGTHDIQLALQTLQQLGRNQGIVKVPRFNKSQDDRYPPKQWETIQSPVDIIIIEGWCVGSQAQPQNELMTAVNTLEATEDSEALWRSYANRQLQSVYPALFSQIDIWMMLKAPSFECVYEWRLEQEEKLKVAMKQQAQTDSNGIMNPSQIARFIQHYQRITEHTLKTLPDQVHFLFELDQHRHIIKHSRPVALN